MPGSDQEGSRYWHMECAAKKLASTLQPVLAAYEGEVPERAALDELIEKAPKKPKPKPFPHADRAPTGRARCQHCTEPLEKGSWRIVIERDVETGPMVTRGAGYVHPACLFAWAEENLEEAIDSAELIEKIMKHTEPTEADQAELLTLLAPA